MKLFKFLFKRKTDEVVFPYCIYTRSIFDEIRWK